MKPSFSIIVPPAGKQRQNRPLDFHTPPPAWAKSAMNLASLWALVAVAVTTAAAGTMAENYAGWKYAVEIQVRNSDAFARPGEVIDVGLSLPASRTSNLGNDARAVLKDGFSELVREVPCQLYDLRTTGSATTCRIAFYADLPPNSTQRFAVFYDNPAAIHPPLANRVSINQRPDSWSIESPFYSAAIDPRTAQCLRLTSKIPHSQPIYDRGGADFPVPAISIPARTSGDNAPELLQPAAVAGDPDELSEGEVFSEVRGRRNLVTAEGAALAQVNFTYLFYSAEPYFVVKTSVKFLRNTPVYSVEMNLLAADQEPLTHYMFRPVSPQLPLTEMEEVGSIMVDAATRRGFSDGDLLAGMLPANLAWQSWANIDRKFAVTVFDLFNRHRSPGGTVPLYRASTRAGLRDGRVKSAIAPIYVAARDKPSHAIPVRRGTVYEEAHAVYFSGWDAADWRKETDGVGRRLNRRPEVQIFPRAAGLPDDEDALPHHGERGDAYLRGIR
ncbi:MAG: hypothetical protein JWQ83_494 [Lacunisphaera sp.]|nr:hypothetical protein [Lacunisphaera sp.]